MESERENRDWGWTCTEKKGSVETGRKLQFNEETVMLGASWGVGGGGWFDL